MRIDVKSFEKWYANQVKHKKVNREAPGTELMKNSYSFKDAANLLEMYDTDLYAIWNRENLETITVDNPAVDATVPKAKKQKREIWTAEMLMQAIDACDNKWFKLAFHLSFTATLRLGKLLGLTWDCVDISEEAIEENRAYIIINKVVERVSREAVEKLDSKDVILTFPFAKKNSTTVRVLKTPKTESSVRKVFILRSVALSLVDVKKEQDEIIEALGNEYQNYNLVMATTFGHPIGECYIREKMKKVIKEQGLPDVVFHSIRHTSGTYKLKQSGGDIKGVQGD